MAFYLVRGRPDPKRLPELREKLAAGAFERWMPFGEALSASLERARFDHATGEAVWEEEDYCMPPLAMEREAVLDHYFTGLTVQRVNKGEGWARIAHLPSLWEAGAMTDDAEHPAPGRLIVEPSDEPAGPVCDFETGRCE